MWFQVIPGTGGEVEFRFWFSKSITVVYSIDQNRDDLTAFPACYCRKNRQRALQGELVWRLQSIPGILSLIGEPRLSGNY